MLSGHAEGESIRYTAAVRSLLRYLHVDGRIPASLTGAVPSVAGWRLDSLPRGLPPQQTSALLAVPDLGTPAGRRDRAVLTVLGRLGLRGAEAAALRLSDIDRDRRAGQRVPHRAAAAAGRDR
ncbi:hypothetical protein ABZU45_36275 [Streptomyces avermitilis]|uniref:hypothetical protein n=1 Tax=Streptomyces avermitilis TaxID=33903 RepID=UPI0033B54CAB